MRFAVHVLGVEVVAISTGDDAAPLPDDHDVIGGQFELAAPLGFTTADPDTDRARTIRTGADPKRGTR